MSHTISGVSSLIGNTQEIISSWKEFVKPDKVFFRVHSVVSIECLESIMSAEIYLAFASVSVSSDHSYSL